MSLRRTPDQAVGWPITLNVNTNNPHAAALYRRLGFTWTGRRARYQAIG